MAFLEVGHCTMYKRHNFMKNLIKLVEYSFCSILSQKWIHRIINKKVENLHLFIYKVVQIINRNF